MEKDIIVRLHQDFEKSVQREQETGLEFWLARDLQKLLDYDEWRNFLKVIEKAKTACLNSGQNISDHFVDVNKMVALGPGSQRRTTSRLKKLVREILFEADKEGLSKK